MLVDVIAITKLSSTASSFHSLGIEFCCEFLDRLTLHYCSSSRSPIVVVAGGIVG